MTAVTAPDNPPELGQLAEVRARRWLVTQVERSTLPISPLDPVGNGPHHLVSLASVEDDGLGEELSVPLARVTVIQGAMRREVSLYVRLEAGPYLQ